MSMSGSRAAIDINLDEFERRLRNAGAAQGYVEDPLSELARLVDEARPTPSSQVKAPVSRPEAAGRYDPVELRSSLNEPEADSPEAPEEMEAEPIVEVGYDVARQSAPMGIEAPARSRKWVLSVSALAVGGVAMIGGAFALKGGVPGLPKQPPFIAAQSGPTKVKPPNEQAAATLSDAGGSLLNESAKPAPVKIVSSEEQPVDLRAEASIGASASSAPQPSASVVKATIDTPVVVASAGAPPAVASQFPDPKPVRTVSLRPDGTPISASAPPAPDAHAAAPASEAPKPAAMAPQSQKALHAAEPSTPKIELAPKPSSKTSARVVVAKTDTTAPEGGEPVALGSTAKPEKLKPAKVHEAAVEKPAVATEPPADAASKSGVWAVQLAAPRSEAEAESAAKSLNAKYAAALNGATIGVQKAVVKGATIYRLRVAGLGRADAAALCARVKGEGGECFVAK